MADNASLTRPGWVSDTLYPFQSRWFDAPRGRIHYIDEGQGTPIVFLHGNPSWSFEYRGPIATLRDRYRCIALDHLGFGLSGRTGDPADYHSAAHAENFAALMDHLDLDGAVLAFSDWGGPIALNYARLQPERIGGLVILNSWCWPVNREWHFRQFSFMMSSWLGQYLIRNHNFFVRKVMPSAVGNRAALTDEVMAHYIQAQPDKAARAASAAFPGYIIGATDWLAAVWNDRAAFADKPALLLWGLKDIAFRRKELHVWQSELANTTVRELPDCGHFVAEEAPDTVSTEIDAFILERALVRE
jgi:haloalkane dehalogenase